MMYFSGQNPIDEMRLSMNEPRFEHNSLKLCFKSESWRWMIT